MGLTPPYLLVPEAPPVADYVRLRREAGLTPRSPEQAARALARGWCARHVTRDGEVVGMGRVVGDGGWYFHLVDIAVHPSRQRQGLGDAIVGHLLGAIERVAPPGAYVSLMADPPGRRLYERHGFVEDRERSVGMARWL